MMKNTIKRTGAILLHRDYFYFSKAFKYFFHHCLDQHRILFLTQELSSKQLCILDEFDLGKSKIFPSLKNAPTLEVTQLCICTYASLHMYTPKG